ncbi:MAG: putative exodeoxyribonuclease [Prokaryotic dsDNA virus sp.]|nr:MAG: putative exodeoxyribonuclease [Prokaryotic dsDNA virus sp.]
MVKKPTDFVVFDIETTGLNVETAEIIELAFVHFSYNEKSRMAEVKEKWQTFVCPEEKPPKHILTLTGIGIHNLKKAKVFGGVAEEVIKWLDKAGPDCPLVTYNGTKFDMPIVLRHLAEVYPLTKDYTENHIDAFLKAKRKLPGLASFKMSNVYEQLTGKKVQAEHSALEDCYTLAEIWEKMRDFSSDKQLTRDLLNTKSTSMEHQALTSLQIYKGQIDVWVKNARELPCNNEHDFRRTVNAVIELKKLRTRLTDLRRSSLKPLKEITKKVESHFRVHAIAPITEAIEQVEKTQQPYIAEKAKQLEEQKELQRRLAAESAEKARQAKLERGETKENANDHADSVYDILTHDIQDSQDNATDVDRGRATVVTSWSCEIINPNQVPKHLWSPDQKKITELVNSTHGKMDIPGVVIKPIYKLRTRAGRK